MVDGGGESHRFNESSLNRKLNAFDDWFDDNGIIPTPQTEKRPVKAAIRSRMDESCYIADESDLDRKMKEQPRSGDLEAILFNSRNKTSKSKESLSKYNVTMRVTVAQPDPTPSPEESKRTVKPKRNKSDLSNSEHGVSDKVQVENDTVEDLSSSDASNMRRSTSNPDLSEIDASSVRSGNRVRRIPSAERLLRRPIVQQKTRNRRSVYARSSSVTDLMGGLSDNPGRRRYNRDELSQSEHVSRAEVRTVISFNDLTEAKKNANLGRRRSKRDELSSQSEHVSRPNIRTVSSFNDLTDARKKASRRSSMGNLSGTTDEENSSPTTNRESRRRTPSADRTETKRHGRRSLSAERKNATPTGLDSMSATGNQTTTARPPGRRSSKDGLSKSLHGHADRQRSSELDIPDPRGKLGRSSSAELTSFARQARAAVAEVPNTRDRRRNLNKASSTSDLRGNGRRRRCVPKRFDDIDDLSNGDDVALAVGMGLNQDALNQSDAEQVGASSHSKSQSEGDSHRSTNDSSPDGRRRRSNSTECVHRRSNSAEVDDRQSVKNDQGLLRSQNEAFISAPPFRDGGDGPYLVASKAGDDDEADRSLKPKRSSRSTRRSDSLSSSDHNKRGSSNDARLSRSRLSSGSDENVGMKRSGSSESLRRRRERVSARDNEERRSNSKEAMQRTPPRPPTNTCDSPASLSSKRSSASARRTSRSRSSSLRRNQNVESSAIKKSSSNKSIEKEGRKPRSVRSSLADGEAAKKPVSSRTNAMSEVDANVA